jgi:hypothetical protein
MPRLGSSGTPSPPRRRRAAQNPCQRLFGNNNSSRPFSPRNVLLFLAAFFVMRNLLRRDYRQEEIQYLRESGMKEEQIHRFIPRTAAEQRKYAQDKTNDVEKMKRDIAYLLNEVAELKTRSMDQQQQQQSQQQQPKQNGDEVSPKQPSQNISEREESLKNMDKIHAEKRQQQEEELLKSNPDFHASKRLKDMTEEEIQKALRK